MKIDIVDLCGKYSYEDCNKYKTKYEKMVDNGTQRLIEYVNYLFKKINVGVKIL